MLITINYNITIRRHAFILELKKIYELDFGLQAKNIRYYSFKTNQIKSDIEKLTLRYGKGKVMSNYNGQVSLTGFKTNLTVGHLIVIESAKGLCKAAITATYPGGLVVDTEILDYKEIDNAKPGDSAFCLGIDESTYTSRRVSYLLGLLKESDKIK